MKPALVILSMVALMLAGFCSGKLNQATGELADATQANIGLRLEVQKLRELAVIGSSRVIASRDQALVRDFAQVGFPIREVAAEMDRAAKRQVAQDSTRLTQTR